MHKKSHNCYIDEVKLINDRIEVMEEYIGARTKIKHKCKICGYGNNGEWKPTPTEILSGNGCPVCASTHSKIGPAPGYKNSIWSSEYRDSFILCLNEEQMKTVTPMSNKKISMRCPSCGNIKNISPNNFIHRGFNCDKCSDGMSYPEKFMMSLLDQLCINYNRQYSPNWADGKKYDFYLLDCNCIIETHGLQHYEESNRGRRLEEEQNNDLYKKELAMKNGIMNYFIVDCRYSNLEWIKSHIISSGVLNFFDILANDIDWTLCGREAVSSNVIIAADLWNRGKLILEISETMQLCRSTIRAYLKKAASAGLCNYNKEESVRRKSKSEPYIHKLSEIRKGKNLGKNHPNAKPIVQLDKNLNIVAVWDTAASAEKETGVDHSRIAACCRFKISSAGGYIWRYVYDQVDKNNNIINGALTMNLISPEFLRQNI